MQFFCEISNLAYGSSSPMNKILFTALQHKRQEKFSPSEDSKALVSATNSQIFKGKSMDQYLLVKVEIVCVLIIEKLITHLKIGMSSMTSFLIYKEYFLIILPKIIIIKIWMIPHKSNVKPSPSSSTP